MSKLKIFTRGFFAENAVFVMLLGLCPTLGTTTSAINGMGMGLATTFVMVITSIVTWLIYNMILLPYHMEFLQYVSFILVIASLVQFVEMFIKKVSQPLYRALGIFLPLITTNCAILGLALFIVLREYTFIEDIFYGLGAGAGFTLAITIMAGIREELDLVDIPKPFKGVPITLIVAGILAMAFMGFSGLIT